MILPSAVTFDFGQTLAEIDTTMLAFRLAEKAVVADIAALDAAVPAAFAAYDRGLRESAGHPWKLFMTTLLETAGARGHLPPVVDWLFDEQPRRNLWRKPIAGMLELVDELGAGGFPVGVVSNAEGGLADLIAELGWTHRFVCVADSGRLGVEKPARGIFAWAAEHLGVPLEGVVHVGDSRAADVEGALAAGQRAVWFGPAAGPLHGERVGTARDARELRQLLHAWGLPVTLVDDADR